jgi:hypothetical protein
MDSKISLAAIALAMGILIGEPHASAAESDNDLSCQGEVVVIGHVVNAAYQGSIDNLNGLWKLEVEVRRVLKGKERKRRVVAYAGGEAEMRPIDFVFFLHPADNGSYGVFGADPDLSRGQKTLVDCGNRPVSHDSR